MLLTSRTLNHTSCGIHRLSLHVFCCSHVAGWQQATRSSLLYRHLNVTWRSGTDTVHRVIGLGVQSVLGTPWLSSSTCAANMVNVIDSLVAEPCLWVFFTFMWPCIVTNVFIIKPTKCTNFTNSILLLLEICLKTRMTYTIVECTVNKLLMMDRRTVRNM